MEKKNYTEKNINKNIKKYISFQKYIFTQKMFVLQKRIFFIRKIIFVKIRCELNNLVRKVSEAVNLWYSLH